MRVAVRWQWTCYWNWSGWVLCRKRIPYSKFSGRGQHGTYARAGKLQILTTTSPAGARFLPGIPSIAQAGFPGYEGDDWFGIYAPAATPLAIRAKVQKEMVRILALPEMRERLALLGAEPQTSTPSAFETMTREYVAAMRKLGDEVGIKAE